jgi:Arc/MetJ-type ribon-helix-helix transcriptional regulator
MKHLKFDIPNRLHAQMENLVKQGWFRDKAEILNLALRKFLNSNRPALLAEFFREDVEWGLIGRSQPQSPEPGNGEPQP